MGRLLNSVMAASLTFSGCKSTLGPEEGVKKCEEQRVRCVELCMRDNGECDRICARAHGECLMVVER